MSGEYVTIGTKHWTVKPERRAARAKAAAETEATRQGAIAALAAKSRRDARARGAKRYIGMPCDRHASAERYVATSQCVFCTAEKVASRRGDVRVYGELRPRSNHRPYMRHRSGPKPKLENATPVIELDEGD